MTVDASGSNYFHRTAVRKCGSAVLVFDGMEYCARAHRPRELCQLFIGGARKNVFESSLPPAWNVMQIEWLRVLMTTDLCCEAFLLWSLKHFSSILHHNSFVRPVCIVCGTYGLLSCMVVDVTGVCRLSAH